MSLCKNLLCSEHKGINVFLQNGLNYSLQALRAFILLDRSAICTNLFVEMFPLLLTGKHTKILCPRRDQISEIAHLTGVAFEKNYLERSQNAAGSAFTQVAMTDLWCDIFSNPGKTE